MKESMAESPAETPILEFYHDCSILLTGFSGFLGKSIAEKLLYSCPEIKCIYVLMRAKKGVRAEERVSKICNSVLFDRVHKQGFGSVRKIVPILGDLALPDLGISAEDREKLAENVSIVFHSASTASHNDAIRATMETNFLGTIRVFDLAREMTNLKSMVYVSTAYSNSKNMYVDEIVYPSHFKPLDFISLLNWADDDTLETFKPKILRDYINMNVFSKSLTEIYLQENAKDVPLCIVRPSIITSTWKEPFPGFVEGLCGTTAAFYGAMTGIRNYMYFKPSSIVDLIPLDISTNLIITASWYSATMSKDKCNVFNCTSEGRNSIKCEEMGKLVKAYIRKYPSSTALATPGFIAVESKTVALLRNFYSSFIAAPVIDTALRLQGKKPQLFEEYQILKRYDPFNNYVLSHSWTFPCKNVSNMLAVMTLIDRNIFNFDISKLSWPEYMEGYILGIRKHILKEELSNLESAKKHVYKLRIRGNLFRLTIGLIALAPVTRWLWNKH